jgi:NTE family protein
VLSGGGARGAYEAGVLVGLRDVLGAEARPTFDILSGASVGALNTTYLAAHAERADQGIPELVELWTSLRLGTHLRPRLRSFFGSTRPISGTGAAHALDASRWGRALLDPRPFERLVGAKIPWDQLHENVRAGIVQAFIVSAFNIATARTNTFVELGRGASFVPLPARDTRREARIERVSADHILASAAIPLLFPARRIGDSYFCDGGLRFNTPIAPAIRSGARKLVIVALRVAQAPTEAHPREQLEQYPHPIFLIGRLLDALLQDPIDYDLQVLERSNRVLDVMAEAVPPPVRERVERVLQAERGLPYRHLRTLVFRPSKNIGVIALEHVRKHGVGDASFTATLLLEKAASLGFHVEADFLSFILFDGAFARTLVDLGRRDVEARAAEVRAFFLEDASFEP